MSLTEQRPTTPAGAALEPEPRGAGATSPAVPVDGAPVRPTGRGPVQRVGVALTVVGVLVCGFVAYQLIVTDLVAGRSQDLLRPRLIERFEVERSLATTTASSGEEDSRAAFGLAEDEPAAGEGDGTDEEITRRIDQPPLGEPIALLRIPDLDLEQVVVEGSGQTQLNSGPGHYRGSPLPGRVGNVVIAGRRATYGAPFERLGSLERGDRIEVATGRGTFDYRVDQLDIVGVGEPDVVGEDGTNKLTLVTADSPLDATGRLVVTARLAGSGAQPSAEGAEASAARLALPDAELGLQRDATAWAPAIVWGQVLVGLWFAGRRLRTRWTPASRWLIGAPTVVAAVILFYESVGRLLPATL